MGIKLYDEILKKEEEKSEMEIQPTTLFCNYLTCINNIGSGFCFYERIYYNSEEEPTAFCGKKVKINHDPPITAEVEEENA